LLCCCGLTLDCKLEPNAFRLLEGGQDSRKICGRRVALWPEHAHQAFCWDVSASFQVLKTGRRIDIIAEYGLANFKIAIDDVFNGFTQKGLAEIRVVLCQITVTNLLPMIQERGKRDLDRLHPDFGRYRALDAEVVAAGL
jgi:hypothetical protein